MKVEAAPFLQEKTIETTGAGDTFCASSLNYVLEHGLDNLTEENLKELLTFANAAASLITTRKGALRVMSVDLQIGILTDGTGVVDHNVRILCFLTFKTDLVHDSCNNF